MSIWQAFQINEKEDLPWQRHSQALKVSRKRRLFLLNHMYAKMVLRSLDIVDRRQISKKTLHFMKGLFEQEWGERKNEEKKCY